MININADHYFRSGNSKDELKDYSGAIEDYNKALDIDSNYSEAYNNRGISKFKLKDYSGAIEDYNKAIDIDSNYSEAYNNRGNVKFKLKDYSGAIEDYNKAIDIEPDSLEPYYNRGISKFKLKDYSGAIEDYNKALDIDPNYSEPYYNRGNVKIKLKDYSGAIEDYNKAIDIDPNYSEAYNNRGNVKIKLKDYSGAIEDYNKAIDIEPDFLEPYYNRGNAKKKLGDYAGSVQDFDKCITSNWKFSDVYFFRGVSKQKLREFSDAIQDFSKAIEFNPNSSAAFCLRGNSKDELKDYSGAIEDYNKAIELDPRGFLAYEYRSASKIKLSDIYGLAYGDLPIMDIRFPDNSIDSVEVCVEGLWFRKVSVENIKSISYVNFTPKFPSEPNAEKYLNRPHNTVPFENIKTLYSRRDKSRDIKDDQVKEGVKVAKGMFEMLKRLRLKHKDSWTLVKALLGFTPIVLIFIYGLYYLLIIYFIIGAVLFIVGKYLNLSESKNWFLDLLFSLILWPQLILFWNTVVKPKKVTYLDKFNEIVDKNPATKNLLEYFSAMNKDGTTEDVIPNGIGRFGYDATNPIPTNSVFASNAYLGRLRDKNGNPINYERLGSATAPNIKNLIDRYKLTDAKGNELGIIYISMYQKTISKKAPEGFTLK